MNPDFKKKMAAYGALSSAFLLAGNHEAEAQVIHVDLPDTPFEVDVDFQVNNNSTETWNSSSNIINLDMNNAQVNTSPSSATSNADFAFKIYAGNAFSNYYTSSTTFTYTNFANAQNFLVQGLSNVIGITTPSNLPSGAVVGPGNLTNFNTISGDIGVFGEKFGASLWSLGNFFAGGLSPSDVTGYLGVRFDKDGNTHYGWVRIRVELDTYTANGVGTNVGAYSRLTILDYAWEYQPDTPITVGDRGPFIPTMGQWGLIVLNLLLVIFGVKAVMEQRKLKLQKAE